VSAAGLLVGVGVVAVGVLYYWVEVASARRAWRAADRDARAAMARDYGWREEREP
jgi:hypothetical protein